MNDTTRELGGALGVAVLGSLVTSQYTSGLAGALDSFPPEVQEVAEGSIGGVNGLIAQGVVPAEIAGRLLQTAKDAFVDGLGLAAGVAAVVVASAAVAVRVLLPSDRQVAGISPTPESPPVSVD